MINNSSPAADDCAIPCRTNDAPHSTPCAVRMFALIVGLWCVDVDAKEFRIQPDTELKPLLKQVAAGDSFVLADGEWTDADLTFELLPGTAEAPIVIHAETPGQVILTGKTRFRFSGEYVTVSGIVVRNPVGVSDVVELRTHSQRHAKHCRFTDCLFEETSEETSKSNKNSESRWLSVYGNNNRIDHCKFVGKRNRGTTCVVWVTESPGDHRIDHNHFGPRPELGRNGGETLRIGTSEVSELDSRTIVEENFFHGCDGEAEAISNKSCANTYRYNVFDECSGTLTLRHGHRCRVEGNVFLGRTKRGTGGVRIIGSSHTIINNYFDGLRGDDERAALSMMNGIPDSPLNEYAPVRDATVSHNTFVDCKVSLQIGVGEDKKQSAAPSACRITRNVFLPGKWPIFKGQPNAVESDWLENKMQIESKQNDEPIEFERVDLKFARSADGLLRPTAASPIRLPTASGVTTDFDGGDRSDQPACGCDEPDTALRTWPSIANTGPSWQLNHDSRSR